MPVLKLSFDSLSPCLKPCFAYCSLFSKDYNFQKDKIVQMWMTHDLIVPEANLLMEDVGYKYFDDLFSRCLFEKSPFDDYPEGSYVMHDLLHDLAQSISKDECVRLECGKPRDIPSTVRHLSVCLPCPKLNITDICKHRKLRTLLFVSNHGGRIDVEFSVELEDLLSHLTYVRVLVLGGRLLKGLPDSIGKFKQLRYLDVHYTKITKFPESLCSLYNLQRFKVRVPTMSYPKRMENLVNLREIRWGDKFICQVADLGRLICLQELDNFDIRKESGHKVEELQKLAELGGRLHIEHLESIDLDRPTDLRIDVSDVQVLEGLQPHPNLEELSIQNYSGIKYPSCLESQLLSNLITFHLIGCRDVEKLPPLGHSSCLREISIENCPKLKVLPLLPPTVVRLEIRNMELNEFPPLGHLAGLKIMQLGCLVGVRKIEDLFGAGELKKGLPSLEEFELVDMPELEEWSGVCGSQFFSCLTKLAIEKCPELRNLPCLPPSLEELRLIKVGLDALLPPGPVPWVSQESSSSSHRHNASLLLREVYIESCPNLKTVEEWLLPEQLPALVRITIIDCAELTSLAIERFKDFTCLQELTLIDCPKLTTSASVQATGEDNHLLFPSSLRRLELGYCGSDLERPPLLGLRVDGLTELRTLESLQRFTSLWRLEIRNCPQLKALPEDGLPTTLEHLILSNCHPDLKERCQKDTGDDWPKIANICKIWIDEKVIQSP